jgi:hypothetical protein
MRLFADDTTLFIYVDDHEEAALTINQDLLKLNQWADQWLVKFSPTKTKSMVVTNRHNIRPPNLVFNDEILDNVESHTHLGLVLNKSLTWTPHIKITSQKAGKRVDILSRLMYKLDRATLETMYLSFIRPVLEYACVVWDGCTVAEANILENIQLRAARIISGAIRHTSHAKIYDELGWETLSQRRERHKLILYHKMVHNLAPEYLCSMLPRRISDRTTYQIRNSTGHFQTPFRCRLSSFEKSFMPSATKLWNELPIETRLIADPLLFKMALMRKPDPNIKKLFSFGKRKMNLIHARLRMCCSSLRANLYDMHIIDISGCNCGAEREDAIHYFFVCPLYLRERNALQEIIIPLAPFNLRTLLYGSETLTLSDNKIIFQAVQGYIEKSKRFD